MKILKGQIKKWNCEEFGNIFKEKIDLEAQLEAIQQREY